MKVNIGKFIIIPILFFIAFICINKTYAEPSFRDYKGISLAEGSFLKGISQRQISTAIAKVGDMEYFINPTDVFIGETNIIPKNSVYIGVIESVMAEVEGINASMKIKITKVVTPDKVEHPLDAYVYWKGKTTIGGDLTDVQYYEKMPHYPGTWKKGALQLVPTSIRYFGKPTVIHPGDEVTFVMNKDINLYGYRK